MERLDSDRASGWWSNPENATAHAKLSLYIDGRFERHILADLPRDDVVAAGRAEIGCGFDVPMPTRVRDGQSHLLELRVGTDGPVLPNGSRKVLPREGAGQAGEVDASGASKEKLPHASGLAFVDQRERVIAGWAKACTAVKVCFDDGSVFTTPVAELVPGFGDTVREGFRLPIPPNLRDGQWHSATVTFGELGDPDRGSASGDALDGSPVRFWIAPEPMVAELTDVIGDRITLRLSAGADPCAGAKVGILVDGVPVSSAISDERGYVHLRLTAATKSIEVLNESATPPRTAGRFTISDSWFNADALQPLPLPRAVLTGPACAEAREAFAMFCEEPDGRFDRAWYAKVAGTSEEEALLHYAEHGAAAGLSPSPLFDERAVRARFPEIQAAIAEGELPAAFALELIFGEGAFCALPDPLEAREHGTEIDEIRPAAALPPPSQQRSASDSIYAAWLARLKAPEDATQEVAADEARVQSYLQHTRLLERPLISIIMPTYNRAYTIGEAVQSVLDQTYDHWELLVCDDASDDKTAQVMDGFDDRRIRYMQFSKSNGAATRNKGLRFARGAYIAYLDSDNLWNPHFLDMMLRSLMASPGSAIAYCGYLDTEIRGAEVHLAQRSHAVFRAIALSRRNFMDLNTIIHHRRVYEWLGGFDNALPRLQDWDLMLRYTSIFQPLFVDHSLVFYRRNVAWGQVTHLFQSSGAQDTVNAKTQRRLKDNHERLRIVWPHRGAVTILVGAGFAGSDALALALAEAVSQFVVVDVIDLSGRLGDAEGICEGITFHTMPPPLCEDPARLGQVAAQFLRDRPVFCLGMAEALLRRLPIEFQANLMAVSATSQGVVARAVNDEVTQFHLGAIPIEGRVSEELLADDKVRSSDEESFMLVYPPKEVGERADFLEQALEHAQKHGLSLVVPPLAPEDTEWHEVSGGEIRKVPAIAGMGCASAVWRVALAASLCPISQLDPYAFSLLNRLQKAGIPLAVVPGTSKDDLVRQWIDARAVYEIKVPTLPWLLEKAGKVFKDPGLHGRLSRNGMTVHRIAMHDQQSRERIANMIYRLLFDPPASNVRYVKPS
ncbi:MAG: glycosyltransferase [Pseudomonadota bacterium]